MAGRWFGWWWLAETISARLTTPPCDIAVSDREVERLLKESWLWACGEGFARKLHAAWLESRLRSWVRAGQAEWPSSNPTLALYGVAWTMRVAAVTALVLQTLKPAGNDPFSWAVPLAVMFAGLLLPWIVPTP